MTGIQTWFVYHYKFLTCCVAEELVYKGLGVMLEPTISNHGQEFLDDWNSKQKQFLLLLMKDIVQFCDKFIGKTTQDIKNTESSLKRSASQYHAMKILQEKFYSSKSFKNMITLSIRVQEEDAFEGN